MKKPKVFIDTNIIDNPTPAGGLFGSSKKLKCLEKRVDLIIPKIVQDELLEHKRRAFEKSKGRLLNSKILEQVVSREKVESLEFCPPCVLLEEDVIFSTEDINDREEFYEWSRNLAIKNEAPFENESDKGIKDAMVAFTIDEYLRNNPDIEQPIILVSDDARLGEYFQERKDVVWVKSLDELEGQLELMTENDNKSSQQSNNTEKETPEECHDSTKAVILTPQLAKARRLLTELRNSRTFATTHKVIAELQSYVKYFTDEDNVDVLLSTLNNSQIMWLAQDEDVEAFLRPIFDKAKDKLSLEQYNDFINRTGWANYRIKEPVEIKDLDNIPF